MKKTIVIAVIQVLVVTTATMIGYTAGSITGTPITVQKQFDTKQCDEIIVAPNFYTKKNDTVCEITLKDGTTLPESGVVGTFQNVSFPLQGNK